MNLNVHEKEVLKDVFHRAWVESVFDVEIADPGTRGHLSAIQKEKDISSLYKQIFEEEISL